MYWYNFFLLYYILFLYFRFMYSNVFKYVYHLEQTVYLDDSALLIKQS